MRKEIVIDPNGLNQRFFIATPLSAQNKYSRGQDVAQQ
jgi:hypothetical protein